MWCGGVGVRPMCVVWRGGGEAHVCGGVGVWPMSVVWRGGGEAHVCGVGVRPMSGVEGWR